MELQTIYELIVQYACMWVPALVAVLTTVCTVVTAIANTNKAIEQLKETKDFKDIKVALAREHEDNERFLRQNKLLLDELKKVKGYSDCKLGEYYDKEFKD